MAISAKEVSAFLQSSFSSYPLFRHKVFNQLAKTYECHEVMERHPERCDTYRSLIGAAQEWATRYLEEVCNGLHDDDAPPEFRACGSEVYEKSRADWTNREEFFAFVEWLKEKFP